MVSVQSNAIQCNCCPINPIFMMPVMCVEWYSKGGCCRYLFSYAYVCNDASHLFLLSEECEELQVTQLHCGIIQCAVPFNISCLSVLCFSIGMKSNDELLHVYCKSTFHTDPLLTYKQMRANSSSKRTLCFTNNTKAAQPLGDQFQYK